MAQFTNRATLTYGNVTRESNVTVGEIISSFAINKKSVFGVYERGDRIAYIIGIENVSNTAYNSVTLTDNLGRFNAGTEEAPLNVTPLTFIPGSLSYWVNGVPETVTATASIVDNNLVITGINVPAGALVQIGYEAIANSFAPLGEESSITNRVTASGTGVSDGIAAEETVNASNALNVNITKALAPARVSENGQVTYTFTLTNSSSRAAEAADALVITDVFNPLLNITNVTFAEGTSAPVTWTAGTDYTYAADGTFTTASGKLTVPAATFATSQTGEVIVTPGTSVLTITGTIA